MNEKKTTNKQGCKPLILFVFKKNCVRKENRKASTLLLLKRMIWVQSDEVLQAKTLFKLARFIERIIWEKKKN